MSEPSGAAPFNAAGIDPEARIWTVEVDGNSYGPYSLNQVSRYLAENRVRAQSTLSSPQFPDRKWTVAEALSILQGGAPAAAGGPAPVARPAGTPPQMPERSTEITKTLSRPVLTEARPEDDPATGLFDVLQTVREQKPAPRIPAMSPQVVGVSKGAKARGQGWKQPQRLVLLGAIALVVIGAMAMMLHWLKASGSKLDTIAEQHSTPTPGGAPAAGGTGPASAGLAQRPVVPPAPTVGAAQQNRPTFKPAPRLVMPAMTPQTPVATPTQQHNAADNRGDRGDNDRRDAMNNDNRDANAVRDPRDFRDPRDPRNAGTPDPRDPRDPRFRDYREETAMPAGTDPNTPANPLSLPNGPNGQPAQSEDPNNPNR